MNRKYIILIVLMLCTYSCILFGQNDESEKYYDPYAPEYFSGTDPAWLQDIVKNPRGVNFFEMEKKFEQWLMADPDAREKTPEKKPAVNFFRRWHKAYKPYVNSKGEIVLPTMEEYLRKLDNHNKQNTQLLRSSRKVLSNTPAWRNIGPIATSKNDIGTGFQASYDSHANVFRIDVSKTNPNKLYCGAETGAVFKTDDKGKNWQACNPTFNFGKHITAIKIDPKNEDLVWVGSDVGLFYSDDGGNTFTRIESVTSRVNSIRVNPDNTNLITVAAHKGFYTYNKMTGQTQITFEGECHDHELKPKSPEVVYLLGKQNGENFFKFYISTNGGKTFNQGKEILKNSRMGRLAVSDAPNGEEYVYALINKTKFGVHHGEPNILQSKDGGKTWVNKTVRTQNKYEYQNTFCPSLDASNGGQGYFDMILGVSDTNPEHVIFGLCSAYRSLQGGSGGYKETTIGGYCSGNFRIHPDMQDIAISNDEVWLANDGGIKYSPNFFRKENNKITGENRVKGIYAADYWGFGQGWNEDVMVGGRWHNGDAVMKSSYGKGKAVYVGGVEQATGYVMVSNPNKVYFSDAGLYTLPQQIDGNITSDYTPFNSKQPYEFLQSHGFLATDPRYAQRILMHPKEGYWGSSNQIWETKDEGLTFELLYDPKEPISYIDFARSNPNTIYACGSNHIFKSADDGKTWEKYPIPENAGTPAYIAVDPKDENKIWFVQSRTQGRVFYSLDGGQNWTNALNESLKKIAFRWVVLSGNEDNGVYIGADSEDSGAKVYYKDDTLPDWIDYSNGLPPAVRLTRLLPFFKDGKLRTATTQGIWEVPLYKQAFKPVAQPIALNIGQGKLKDKNTPVQFDTYSIVNQNNVSWEWSFSPEPQSVSNKNIRNPRVIFGKDGIYDVTLKVTTPEGAHSRTIRRMIRVGNVTDGILETQNIARVKLLSSRVKKGEKLIFQTEGFSADKTIILIDLKGRKVKQLRTRDDIISIDTDNINSGVYIYLLTTPTLVKRGKFIVQ